jgi:hypothetical protein
MTRTQLLRSISSYELEQWAALYRVEAEERKAAEAEHQKNDGRPALT